MQVYQIFVILEGQQQFPLISTQYFTYFLAFNLIIPHYSFVYHLHFHIFHFTMTTNEKQHHFAAENPAKNLPIEYSRNIIFVYPFYREIVFVIHYLRLNPAHDIAQECPCSFHLRKEKP